MSRTYSAPPVELVRQERDFSHIASSPTNMSIRSSHVHWKKNPPNSNQLGRIEQVVYKLQEGGKEKRKGLVDVWAVNTYGQVSDHWRWFPAVYTDHLKLIFYRMALYVVILDQAIQHRGVMTRADINELKLYIGYMDKVLDDTWEETRVADEKGQLTAAWRSRSFDKWLVIEHTIGRHDPESIGEAFGDWNRSDSGEFLEGNPMELGKSETRTI